MFRMPDTIEELVYYDGPLMFTARHPVSNELLWINNCDGDYTSGLIYMVLTSPSLEHWLKELKENNVTIYDFITTQHYCRFWFQAPHTSYIAEWGPIPLWVVRPDYFPKKDVYLNKDKWEK